MTPEQSNEWFARHFELAPVMAILRGLGLDETLAASRRAWDAGAELVEIPLQRAEDRDVVVRAVELGHVGGKAVGVGTVLDVGAVQTAHALGAAFTVSPGFSAEVYRESLRLDMPSLPGVATATEIQAAFASGALWLKAFPAKDLGTNWISAMLAPFPDVRIVATGGVTASSAEQFLSAGAAAVAIGSAIANADLSPLLGRSNGVTRAVPDTR